MLVCSDAKATRTEDSQGRDEGSRRQASSKAMRVRWQLSVPSAVPRSIVIALSRADGAQVDSRREPLPCES